jgi:hypothetical protein
MAKKYIESNIITYTDIKNIFGYTCEIKGETELCYYKKEFRYSTDNILWSDYRELSNKNLSNVVTSGGNLYIQYRFTQVGEGKLSVESISLDFDSSSQEKSIPDCYWTLVNNNRYSTPSLVYSQSSSNLFNPYSIGSGYSFYSQMSTLVSNMFGLCVLYFKTEPNSRSRDVVLKEYSIEHVIDKQNIKILVPDNQLPSRELQFNTMMIDYPVQFEIHIVKSEFQKVFGTDSHPDPHDYLYFQTYMNKMYMVDAVSDPDDFGYTGTYWRVSLVPYQEMSSVKFGDDDLQEDTETLIFSAEGKFKDEMDEEIANNRKDSQLNPMGDWLEGQDRLRRYLEPNVRIRDEKIYNDWTIIADSYYDLSTVEPNQKAVEYKYTTGFSSTDERMISFIFKPNNTSSNVSDNIMISNISKGDVGGVKITVKGWNGLLKVGNYVNLFRVNDFNGFKKIISVNKSDKTIEVEGTITSKTRMLSCAKLIGYDVNTMFNITDDTNSMFSLTQIYNKILLNLNGQYYDYEFDGFSGFENKWYILMMGLKGGMSNIWLYEIKGSEETENVHTSLSLIGRTSNDLGNFDLGETCCYDLMTCNMKLTNFRLWSKLCEEEKHNLILSQLIVDDNHNTLIIDNAQSEILLNNKYS